MNDSQAIPVLISILFSTVMFIIVLIKGPRISPFTKAKFSTKKLPMLIKFLIGVACVSVAIGFFFNQQIEAVGQYILLNCFIGLVMGVNLWLFQDTNSDKNKTK